MSARIKTLLLMVTGLVVVCPCARGQAIGASAAGLVKDVEKGNKIGSLGARLGLFLTKNDRFASGLEMGYARLTAFESELHMGPSDESELTLNRTKRKLWYATFNVRRHWLGLGPSSGLYAGGGTGVYYIRNNTQSWEPSVTLSSIQMAFRESAAGSAHFGLNFGGGWTFAGTRLPGALDLDMRFHLLPFAGGSDVRTLLTFSAGLNLF